MVFLCTSAGYSQQPVYPNGLWSLLYRELNVTPCQNFWQSVLDSAQTPTIETYFVFNNILNTRYHGNKLNVGKAAYGLTVSNPLVFNKKHYGYLKFSHMALFSNNQWNFGKTSNELNYHEDIKNYTLGYRNKFLKTLEMKTQIGFIHSEKHTLFYSGVSLGYGWSRIK